MTDASTDQLDKDAQDATNSAQMSKALKVGFLIGTPTTFLVFFAMMFFGAHLSLGQALVTSIWVAIVGGGFYGGVAGLLTVLNKHPH